jgi:hypothetical protein
MLKTQLLESQSSSIERVVLDFLLRTFRKSPTPDIMVADRMKYRHGAAHLEYGNKLVPLLQSRFFFRIQAIQHTVASNKNHIHGRIELLDVLQRTAEAAGRNISAVHMHIGDMRNPQHHFRFCRD